VSRKYGSWQEALPAYLVPQEVSQTHQTTMTAQAVQTKEHDEEQDDIGSKWYSGAEFDAIQVEHAAVDAKAIFYLQCRAEL